MRHAEFHGIFILLAAAAVFPMPAKAQQVERFALDPFQPAPAGARFFTVQGPEAEGERRFKAMLLAEYARRPLVAHADQGDDEIGAVVSDQLFVHLALALALGNRLAASLDMPAALVNAGDDPPGLAVSPSGADLGDLR